MVKTQDRIELYGIAGLVERDGVPNDRALRAVLHEKLLRIRPPVPFDLEPDRFAPPSPSMQVERRRGELRSQYDDVRLWQSLMSQFAIARGPETQKAATPSGVTA